MASAENVTVPFFKKKGRGRPTTTRKRSESPPASALTGPVPSSSKSQVVLPPRKQTANLLSAGTKRTVSQRDGDYDDDADKRDGPDVKWTAEGSHRNAALEIIEGDEAEALLAKRRREEKKGEDEEEVPDDGLYRGQKGYQTHLLKNKEVPKAMRVGPQRSTTSTIRTVTIVDYQPDVCKDYKGAYPRASMCQGRMLTEPPTAQRQAIVVTATRASSCTTAGRVRIRCHCTFRATRPADTRCFLGPYSDLQGWQLDKLAANPNKDAAEESDSDSDDEDIPFACLICRKPYTDPVATRCSHYFCSACAIKRFAKTPKCAACGAPTGGIFNRADKVIAKLRKKQEAKAAGDHGDDDDVGEGGSGARGVHIEGLGQASGDDDGSDEE